MQKKTWENILMILGEAIIFQIRHKKQYPWWLSNKESDCNAGAEGAANSTLGWEDPWRRTWQPTPVFLPGEFHGHRSLEGYSSWGRKVRHD